MPAPTETTETTYEADVLKHEGVCCVYFNARWCKAGADLAETVSAAADEVGDRMRFFEVDADTQGRIVTSRNVHTIPTFHFVKAGETVDQLRGSVSKLDLLGKISAVLTEHDSDAPVAEPEPSPEPPSEETPG